MRQSDHWRVAAYITLIVSGALVWPASAVADPPDVPTLVQPADQAVMYDGTLFEVAGDEGEYRVQYSLDDEFGSAVFCDSGWVDEGFNPQTYFNWPDISGGGGGTGYSCASTPYDYGTYFWRASFRDRNTLDESGWTLPQSVEYEETPPSPPAPPPPPPPPCCDGGGSNTDATFGGWWTERSSTGVTVRATRATIYVESMVAAPLSEHASWRLVAHRVVVEADATTNPPKLGLIQAGVISSTGNNCYDEDFHFTSYTEWKTAHPSSAYHCELYGGSHNPGTAKKYAVTRTSDCTGCWIAKMNGGNIGSYHNLGTTYNDFNRADRTGATGEYNASCGMNSCQQASKVWWGNSAPGRTEWERTSDVCCSQSWTDISAPNWCDNRDDHWKFVSSFNQTNGFYVKRWVTNGSPNSSHSC